MANFVARPARWLALVSIGLAAACGSAGIPGSTGPAGDAGESGYTGETGDAGAAGATGGAGAPGSSPDVGAVSIKASEGNGAGGLAGPLAGVLITAQTIGGGALVTDGGALMADGGSSLIVSAITDANGSASLSLPGGPLELTFTKIDFTSPAPLPIVVSAVMPISVSITLNEAASGGPALALISQATDIGYGATVAVTAMGTSPLGDALTYTWSNSSAYGLGYVSGVNTAGAVTTPTLAQANLPNGNVDAGNWISGYRIPSTFGVLPILEDTRGSTTATVIVTDGFGQSASASVTVTAASRQTGAQGVAIGTRVYLNSGTGSGADAGTQLPPGLAWSLAAPAGSAAAFDNSSAQFPSFIPDVGGAYRVALGANQLTLYAGSWDGMIAVPGATSTSTQNGTVPFGFNAICISCHTTGGAAIDQFTPWAGTRHAVQLTNALDGVAGFAFGASNLPSQSVGFDPGDTNSAAGGLNQVAARLDPPWAYPAFPDPGNWAFVPAAIAKLSNVQCESCHGPQGDGNGGISAGGGHTLTDAAQDGGTHALAPFQSPRISYAAESCGTCHADGTNHHEYTEWATLNPDDQKGHANLAVAQSEGLQAVDGGPAFANANVEQLNSSCGRCHTAQGFTEYVANLQAGNVGALAPAQQGLGQLTLNNVQPQTCQTCHDPHLDALDPTGASEHQLRAFGDVPLLPSGFAAPGMGAGAVCIECHNSRNGAYNASASTNATTTAYLHEDSDWIGSNPGASNTALAAANYVGLGATFTSLSTPHEANQGDVFEGHNAYFLGSRTPVISPHAAVKDTCAGCHMANNPGTFVNNGVATTATHLFAVTNAQVPLLCAKCHAAGTDNVNGASLQASVTAGLATLAASLNAAILARFNDAASPANYVVPAGYGAWKDTGTVTIPAKALTDATPGCTAGTGTCGQPNTTALTISTNGNPAVTAVATPGRTTTVLITLLHPISVAFTGGVNANLQTFSVSLASLEDASASPLFAANGNLFKAIWNYELIAQDGSLGVHNPPFVAAVLAATAAPFGNPNATPVQPGGLWY